jgi:hypothetical protein
VPDASHGSARGKEEKGGRMGKSSSNREREQTKEKESMNQPMSRKQKE